VGNNKGVKSVFSGHWIVLLLLRKNACAATERHKSPTKSDLREYGEDCLVAYLLEDLQRVD